MIKNAPWEIVAVDHPDFDSNGEVYGTLYRYPIWKNVPAGTTVEDGWGQPHTAPNGSGSYILYQYVQGGTLQGFQWERE